MTDDREDLLAHLAGLFRVERPRCLHGCLHLMLFGGNVSGSDPLRRDGDRDGVGCKSSRLQHRGSFRLVGSKKGVVMMVCRRGRGDLRRIEKVDERTRFGSLLSMQRRWAADEQMMNVDSNNRYRAACYEAVFPSRPSLYLHTRTQWRQTPIEKIHRRSDEATHMNFSHVLLAVRIHGPESSQGKIRERGGRSAKKRH